MCRGRAGCRLSFPLGRSARPNEDCDALNLVAHANDEVHFCRNPPQTAGYMSPEQVRGETLDHRSDIFAFGLIFLKCWQGSERSVAHRAPICMAAILRVDMPPICPRSPSICSHPIPRCVLSSMLSTLMFDLGYFPESKFLPRRSPYAVNRQPTLCVALHLRGR